MGNSYIFCCKSVASEAFCYVFIADVFMEITFICTSIWFKLTFICTSI